MKSYKRIIWIVFRDNYEQKINLLLWADQNFDRLDGNVAFN